MRDVELDRCVLGLQSTGEQLCSRQHRRPVHAERSIYPERLGYQVLTLFGKLGYSQFLRFGLGLMPDPRINAQRRKAICVASAQCGPRRVVK